MSNMDNRMISSDGQYMDDLTTSAELPRTRFEYVDVIQDKIEEVPHYVKEIRKVPVIKHNIIPQDKYVNRPVINKIRQEVVQPQYVQKQVDIPQVRYVDIPVQQEVKVPRIEVKVVHEEVNVPGAIYHVPKPVVKEVHQTVFSYTDNEVPVHTKSTVQPDVAESTEYKQKVKAKKFVPQLIPVEFFLPVPIYRKMRLASTSEETRATTMSAGEFNAFLKELNPNIPEEHMMSVFQRNPDGSIPTKGGVRPAPPPSPGAPSISTLLMQQQQQPMPPAPSGGAVYPVPPASPAQPPSAYPAPPPSTFPAPTYPGIAALVDGALGGRSGGTGAPMTRPAP
eukprot:Protomagalhaensia_sp_Gyna_25__5247@NODE_63_length_5749_cov_361_425919_g46_i0_p2_GENE_NODE_63_length_5749_cov_361_425919_g46_i0NODE_63_length_5749_cov_361_425919_g46_i0_p2_ORF_typecomplete_len337_score72_96GET2/PF08690_10/0_097_NODE_63_length_5749_cov_361_425919_g46_i03811391